MSRVYACAVPSSSFLTTCYRDCVMHTRVVIRQLDSPISRLPVSGTIVHDFRVDHCFRSRPYGQEDVCTQMGSFFFFLVLLHNDHVQHSGLCVRAFFFDHRQYGLVSFLFSLVWCQVVALYSINFSFLLESKVANFFFHLRVNLSASTCPVFLCFHHHQHLPLIIINLFRVHHQSPNFSRSPLFIILYRLKYFQKHSFKLRHFFLIKHFDWSTRCCSVCSVIFRTRMKRLDLGASCAHTHAQCCWEYWFAIEMIRDYHPLPG